MLFHFGNIERLKMAEETFHFYKKKYNKSFKNCFFDLIKIDLQAFV